MDYYGLAANPSGENFPAYRCKKCNSSFIDLKRNPPAESSAVVEQSLDESTLPKSYGPAIKLFEEFNRKPADKIIQADIKLPDNYKNPLVWLGKIAGVIYISDKEGRKGQRYIHECDAPYPDFFVTADRKTYIISGGKLELKDGWLYY